MPTVDHLLFLMHNGAVVWRIQLAARAVLAKVIMGLEENNPISHELIALRETL